MNEQLQQALADILNSALSAKDFLVAELPDVVKQLLVWKFWENFVYFWLAIALVVFVIVMAPRTLKKCIRDENATDPFYRYNDLAPVNLFWLVAIIPVSFLLNFKWLQIWLAPKIFLIEYAASFAK